MDTSTAHHNAHTPARAGTDLIGRVVAVSGSQATVELNARNAGGEHPTVGKFMGMVAGNVPKVPPLTVGAAASDGRMNKATTRQSLRIMQLFARHALAVVGQR
jgi:hypothetical protein